MFVSVFAAIVMFAAPDAAQSAGSQPDAKPAAAAPAKPAMHKVCYKVETPDSAIPHMHCVMKPVDEGKAADGKTAEGAPAKADPPKKE